MAEKKEKEQKKKEKKSISKSKKLLYYAILAGFLAAVIHVSIIISAKGKYTNTKEYVVAAQNYVAGEPINKVEVIKVSGEVDAKISNRYLTKNEFNNDYKGQAAKWEIYRNEFVSKEALGAEFFSLDMSKLGPNQRYISISVDEESSIGYRLTPGDSIDIYSICTDSVKLISPRNAGAEIAAVGSESRRSRSDPQTTYRTIVLKVNEYQAKNYLDEQVSSGGIFKIALRKSNKNTLKTKK